MSGVKKVFQLGENGMDMEGNILRGDEVEIDDKDWYNTGKNYWQVVADKGNSNIDGMLGGQTHVHDSDITESLQFLKNLNVTNFNYVLDCGAGVGRVSQHLLAPIFKNIDILDINKDFLDVAQINLSTLPSKPLRNTLCQGLQDFKATQQIYDVIWVQWASCYLTDVDFITFMNECYNAMTPGSTIVFKENVASKKGGDFVIDKEDCSINRSVQHYHTLFTQCSDKFQFITEKEQLWQGLLPVMMFALRRK
ncbi:hypothetical protein AKO1_014934 [Acrasis kona]|uniref:Alpha N-terminal protein methyltransferase 1 n=1 Tax=Acrasis kona TaxID=1008807 RepID=A0AAW2YZU5_9EUKA